MTLGVRSHKEGARVEAGARGRLDLEKRQIAGCEPRGARHDDALDYDAISRSVAENCFLIQREVQVAAVHDDVSEPGTVDRRSVRKLGKDSVCMYSHAIALPVIYSCGSRLSWLREGCNGICDSLDYEIYLTNGGMTA